MALSETRKDLIAAVWQIQCHPLFKCTDLVTPCASPRVSDDQVRNHIEGLMKAIARYA